MGRELEELYNRKFYEVNKDTQGASSLPIVEIIKEFFTLHNLDLESVVDVGCGTGAMLSCWMNEGGLLDCLGIDGDYVEESLVIPKENWIAHDLTQPLELARKFDLAECFEVAEHLDEKYAEQIIKLLCELSNVVVFSAAIPFQGGTHHVNEQFQSYWKELFEKCGFVAFDYIRPKINKYSNVAWWYKQNIIVYVNEEFIKKRRLCIERGEFVLDYVSKELYVKNMEEVYKNRLLKVLYDDNLEKEILMDLKEKINNRKVIFYGAGKEALLIDYYCDKYDIYSNRLFIDTFKKNGDGRLPICSNEEITNKKNEYYIVITLLRKNTDIEKAISSMGYGINDYCYYIDLINSKECV